MNYREKIVVINNSETLKEINKLLQENYNATKPRIISLTKIFLYKENNVICRFERNYITINLACFKIGCEIIAIFKRAHKSK